MFAIAIFIGVYSYIIFTLGILGLIYKPVILLTTLVYLLLCAVIFRSAISKFKIKFEPKENFKFIKTNKLFSFVILVILIQAAVNLIGVMGPEISFDSLWYHLTLPKLYILNHSIFHVPGSNLFYSDMPKLTEMLYASAMVLMNDTYAKLIHFTFGILILIAIYKLGRKFTSKEFSMLAAMIFYANLVVGWESITAYVDLSRTFFELMAVWGFLNWLEERTTKNLILTGIMLGLAVSAKLISLSALVIFLILFIYHKINEKEKWINVVKNILLLTLTTLIIPLPWFIFSYLNTGNPLYPYFSNSLVDSGNTFVLANASRILVDIFNSFLKLNDPISPIYLIVLPLIIYRYRNFSTKIKLLFIYIFAGFSIWFLIEQPRGGRFLLPYLPVLSIVSVYAISLVKHRVLKKYLILLLVLVSFISIGYRSIANVKFIPVILGQESRQQFLTKYLNFSFGDFYDTDNYFKNHLTNKDTVLLFGFGKLYYVDFNFIDSSWVKNGDKFNYIAVKNGDVPIRFKNWEKIYYNNLTKVSLYSLKGKQWVY
jgi:hypothetical protein